MAADGDDTVSFLPTDGSTVYATLWYRAASSSSQPNRWLSVADSFTAASSGGPTITSPTPGSSISGPTVTLTWEPGEATVSEWWIYIGSTVGGNDIDNTGSLGTSLSTSVDMPANGSTAHVTLWYKVDGIWRNSNYVFQSDAGT